MPVTLQLQDAPGNNEERPKEYYEKDENERPSVLSKLGQPESVETIKYGF